MDSAALTCESNEELKIDDTTNAYICFSQKKCPIWAEEKDGKCVNNCSEGGSSPKAKKDDAAPTSHNDFECSSSFVAPLGKYSMKDYGKLGEDDNAPPCGNS